MPGDFVDEGKLLLFISEEVATRAPRRGPRLAAEKKRKAQDKAQESRKRRRLGSSNEPADLIIGDDDDEQSDLVLMYNTVRGYVSAINELWAHQVSRRLHNSPKPVQVAMKALKSSIARGEHAQRRAEFADRGIATIQDGYMATQIPIVYDKVWGLSLGAHSAEMSLRTYTDFLFGNTMLLRSSNRLPMELPDLFLMPLPREGIRGDGWCIVMVTDQGKYTRINKLMLYILTTYIGKTNQHGRLEYGSALRHRDFKSCLISALATYFFWRWHISGEPFPCFRTSRDWYNIKVLKRDNIHLQEPLLDSTAASWTRRLFEKAGIYGTKVGHAGKVKGAQIAELRGVGEDQVSMNFIFNLYLKYSIC